MKKILCMCAAALMMFSSVALADENVKTPKVIVNGCEVVCPEQGAVIKDDFTLVPARYVFQVLEAKVSWYQDKQLVMIDSKDNITRIFLNIDSDIMKVVTFKSILNAETKEVKLEVPAQIVNDRTLIPLRAVSEALGADVSWDEDTYTAYVDLLDKETKRMKASIKTDVTDVSAGDEFNVYYNVENLDLYPEFGNAGFTAGVKYDKEKFEFLGANMVTAENEENSSLGATNPDFLNDSVKAIYISIEPHEIKSSAQNFGVLKFKALTDEGGELTLSSRYTDVGYDSTVLLMKGTESQEYSNPNELTIDTTPIVLK